MKAPGLNHDIPEADIAAYLGQAQTAPRITSMLGNFSDLVTGRKGRPGCPVTLDETLLGHDMAALRFADIRARHAGVFNQHFVTSLPYILEEQCRFGAAVLDYAEWLHEQEGRPLDFYGLGDASGVMGRALAEAGAGKIRSLTCSPNIENQEVFYAGRTSALAHFFLGPFFELTPHSLAERGLGQLSTGFDIIFEDTSFQMYGSERRIPIALAARNLRPDGIFVMLEKFAQADQQEFLRRERQKDEEFKARFYSKAQIEEKKRSIVDCMDRQLVTLEEYQEELSGLFSHAVIIWNSGNFYTVAASNTVERLTHFVRQLIDAAIPDAFRYVDLPRPILGEIQIPYEFRDACPDFPAKASASTVR
jgi:hypothetical protein